MRPVLTSADLWGIAAGGEVVITPDTLVTALAREEAEQRGITLRVVEPASGAKRAATREAETQAGAPRIVAGAVKPIGGETDLDQLIRAVVEEVLGYLGAGRRDPVCSGPGPGTDVAAIAALIDHTLLKPDASRSEIERLCGEAVDLGFAAVCVNPWYVPLATELLRDSGVKVCAVVGFLFGANLPQVKMREAEEAIKLGAREIDMVQNIGALKSGQDDQVEEDIRGVAQISHRGGAICKVILETALLTTEEKVRAALAAKRAGADFVKTSTGFASGGATAADVALLRSVVGGGVGVKAAGGIRTLADLQAMVAAGATRIGTSAGVKILEQVRALARLPPDSP